ncbi:AAA family ATPase [Micromonospora sp. DT229]|uniref:AAA family ATPase n=1 Tax=Micromonospora sp. DT229 TaxID=3393430 RepID=UPI003CEB2679
MIIWLNGAFGAGKTTVADALCRRLPTARRVDPEWIGGLLRRVRKVPTGDYQDLVAWRRWTVRLVGLAAHADRPVVVPMSLLQPTHRTEILDGLRDRGRTVRQLVLQVPEPALRARIDADAADVAARAWRQRQVSRALTGLAGLADREPDTIEVTNDGRTPEQVAAEIIDRLGVSG